jgi:hypothetical protein
MLIGEVHTGLLQHSTSLPMAQAVGLLSLVQGANVLSSQRPIAYAVSPEIPVGVDCSLPSASGRKVRGVGAVVSRALLSGGRVVQASAAARIERSAAGRRLAWSHYIARPGRLEAIGKMDWADIAAGFLQPHRGAVDAEADGLDLAGIAVRLIDTLQMSDGLDRRAPLRTQRTRLRWAVTVDERFAADGSALFTVEADGLRTVRLALGPQDAEAAQELCEDLALHDWLLTTIARCVEETASSPHAVADKATRLRPVVEHLLHLWMPGARVAPELLAVWDVFERRPGFTRQWTASVEWIRDQLASGTLALLQRPAPVSR